MAYEKQTLRSVHRENWITGTADSGKRERKGARSAGFIPRSVCVVIPRIDCAFCSCARGMPGCKEARRLPWALCQCDRARKQRDSKGSPLFLVSESTLHAFFACVASCIGFLGGMSTIDIDQTVPLFTEKAYEGTRVTEVSRRKRKVWMQPARLNETKEGSEL